MNKKDLIQGNIFHNLIKFSLPLLLGNVFQVAYNTADSIWVGKYIGTDALGAVTVSFPIIFILISLILGITMATTVLVSQYAGANNKEMVNKTINNSFLLLGIGAVIVTIIGIIYSEKLLILLGTDDAILKHATDYLNIFFFGLIFMFGYNLISSILRGLGDSFTPLIFLVISSVLNIILDPLFILGVGPLPEMGISGAAIATLISQAVSFFLSLIYLKKYNKMIRIRWKEFKFDREITKKTLHIGLPTGVQQTVVSLGILAMTYIINLFSNETVAAFGAASRIDQFATMPAMSIGIAASAFTGQCIGAGKVEKVKEIYKYASIMTLVLTGLMSLFIVSFPGLLLTMFTDDQEVIKIGSNYLRIVGFSYLPFALMFITNGILRGAGDTIPTLFFSIFSLAIIRVPLAYYLSTVQKLGSNGIWIAIAISFTFSLVLSQTYYYTGIWKKKKMVQQFTLQTEG